MVGLSLLQQLIFDRGGGGIYSELKYIRNAENQI